MTKRKYNAVEISTNWNQLTTLVVISTDSIVSQNYILYASSKVRLCYIPT